MEVIGSPFRAAEKLAAGALTARELRGFHEAIYPGVWMPRGSELDAIGRARAAWLWSNRRGVPSGLSAAAVLGAKWIEPECPAELVHSNRRAPPGITVHTDVLVSGEWALACGMPVTTPARTAFDLGRRLPTRVGVERIDALMNATGLKVVDVERVARGHPGVRGLHQLGVILELVDGGAESPYESVTRLLLVKNGFPTPLTQIQICDESGQIFARLDMGWPQWKVAVEYDGAQHWDRQSPAGVGHRPDGVARSGGLDRDQVSTDMLSRRGTIIDRVAAALSARGCPRTW